MAGTARVRVMRLATGVVEIVVRGVHAIHGPTGRLNLGRGAEDLVYVVLEVCVEGASAAAHARLGTLLTAVTVTVFLVLFNVEAPAVVALVIIRSFGEIALMWADLATKVAAHHGGGLFLAQDRLRDGTPGRHGAARVTARDGVVEDIAKGGRARITGSVGVSLLIVAGILVLGGFLALHFLLDAEPDQHAEEDGARDTTNDATSNSACVGAGGASVG